MIALLIILLIIVITMAVVVSFDIIPFLNDAFMRMKIGSLYGENWFDSACSAAHMWAQKGLPDVPQVAGKRFAIIDRIKGTNKSDAIQSWQSGSVLLALNEVKSSGVEDLISKHINLQTGEWQSFLNRVDSAFLAYAILSCEKTDIGFVKPAMEQTFEMLHNLYKNTGSIPYSKNNDYRYVDTIGLVCPFLVKYALVYDDERALEMAVSLIKEYSEYGLHKEFNLPVHCFSSSTKAPLGIYGWGRGCGWWAIGLAESFKALNQSEKADYTDEKVLIIKNIITFADTIIRYQNENGSFDRNVFAPSGADSSATSMIAFLLSYIGKLSGREEYLDSAKKAMSYIYSVTRRDGVVDYSQGDTMGIGFYSQESIVLPVTQGYAIRTYIMLNIQEV